MNKQLNHVLAGFLMLIAVLIIAWAAKIAVSAGASVEEDLAGENIDPPAPVIKTQNIQNKKGQELFKEHCSACHAVDRTLAGPALAGIEERVKDKKLLYAWIKNSSAVLATGDKYFTNLYTQYNQTMMTPFPGLTDEDIDNILKYINEAAQNPPPPMPAVAMRYGIKSSSFFGPYLSNNLSIAPPKMGNFSFAKSLITSTAL